MTASAGLSGQAPPPTIASFWAVQPDHRIAMVSPPEISARLAEAEALLRAADQQRSEAAAADRRYALKLCKNVSVGVEDRRKADIALTVAKQIFFYSTDLFDAVEPSALAVDYARLSGERDLLRHALMVQAVLLTDLGNVADAFVALEEGLGLAEAAAEDFRGRAIAWINFGKACYTAYYYADALTAYEQGKAYCDQAGLRDDGAVALQNIALCCLEINRHERGLAAIREAINLMGEPVTPTQHFARVFAEATFVRLLLADGGRHVEARERLVFAKRSAERSASVRAELAVAGIEGLLQVYTGSADLGREIVLAHLERARAVPSTMRTALLTAVQALEHAGDAATALSYHREFALLVKRQLREKVLQYTRRQLLAIQDPDRAVGSQAIEEHAAALRSRYVNEGPQTAGAAENFLLSQAMMGEAEWDSAGTHVFRVGELVRRLAQAYGLDESTCDAFARSARLHDIGMTAVPRSLKIKSGAFSLEEWSVVEKHCDDGAELIGHCALPYRDFAEAVARHHHECFDGSGYPDSLRGSAIPLSARMTALADLFDVATHDSRHAPALSVDAALTLIEQRSGSQFDPELAKLFVGVVNDLRAQHGEAHLDEILSIDARESAMSRIRARIRR